MSLSSLTAALVGGLIGVPLAAAPTSVGASEVASIKICPTLHAAHWKMGSKSGNTWIVSATSPTKCGFAEKTGSNMTRQKVNASGNFAKPPKGYVCAGSPFGGHPQSILCHANYGTGAFNVIAG